MIALATIVDWEALLDAALASLVGALAVVLAASTAIFGAATFTDAQRDERYGIAAVGALLTLVGLLVFGAAIAAGLYVMING